MVAETISLGILSLPAALSTMGIIPGVTLIVMLGIMAMYTGFVIGDFKLAYPHVENFADALQIVCGKYGNVGRAFGWVFQETLLLFIIAAHILTFGVELNVLTNHASCTLAFTAIGAIVCFVFTLPRTFKGNRYISLFCELTQIFLTPFFADANPVSQHASQLQLQPSSLQSLSVSTNEG